MRLGFATQLATERAIGTFLAHPTGVPDEVVKALVRQLRIADTGVLVGYAKAPGRWQHTVEIRERYGYTALHRQSELRSAEQRPAAVRPDAPPIGSP